MGDDFKMKFGGEWHGYVVGYDHKKKRNTITHRGPTNDMDLPTWTTKDARSFVYGKEKPKPQKTFDVPKFLKNSNKINFYDDSPEGPIYKGQQFNNKHYSGEITKSRKGRVKLMLYKRSSDPKRDWGQERWTRKTRFIKIRGAWRYAGTWINQKFSYRGKHTGKMRTAWRWKYYRKNKTYRTGSAKGSRNKFWSIKKK